MDKLTNTPRNVVFANINNDNGLCLLKPFAIIQYKSPDKILPNS